MKLIIEYDNGVTRSVPIQPGETFRLSLPATIKILYDGE